VIVALLVAARFRTCQAEQLAGRPHRRPRGDRL